MEHFSIDKDINVLCVTATSFPDGVMAAHQEILQLAPETNASRYYGLSRPEKGVITYKAAAEELYAGEGAEKGLEVITIRAGKYIGKDITDFMNNIAAIGQTFQQILQEPGIDPNGYCVEWYYNEKDVRCMVRLAG